MSVSLLRLRSGRIALFYLVKNSLTDCRLICGLATDEAKTWDKPDALYRRRGLLGRQQLSRGQLSTGRLIFPTSRHEFFKNQEGKTGLGPASSPHFSPTTREKPGTPARIACSSCNK